MKKAKFSKLRFLIIIFTCLIISFSLYPQINVPDKNSDINPEYYHVPNTKIEIMPPAHFHFMEQISGFLHVGTSSSIQIQEISGTSYQIIVQGLTESHFESQGVTFISKEDIRTLNGKSGVIYTVGFKVEDMDFERLMFFSGDYNNTIWINANYPVVMKDILNVVLRESLLTAKFIN